MSFDIFVVLCVFFMAKRRSERVKEKESLQQAIKAAIIEERNERQKRDVKSRPLGESKTSRKRVLEFDHGNYSFEKKIYSFRKRPRISYLISDLVSTIDI
jgi:ATPase subunit of ABC transporter with duplicated ATPase domains